MKGKLMTLLACFLMVAGVVTAQNQKVTGLVVSAADNEPVVGASVAVKGVATLGAITDLDGKFEISGIPASAKTLVVSYVGMATSEVAIRPYVKVALVEDAEVLEEVVIAVPYGTVKKTNFSGSAAQVSGEKLAQQQVSNISNALQGTIAGVQTTSSSGTPGSGSTIMVRGIGSISATATPLIVVDGVPYSGSLNSISAYDIESLTILKDAAANSMYGARGANGVVMVTTKSGSNRKARVTFDARYGWNERGIPAYNVITDAGEYYEMLHESVTNNLAATMGYSAASTYAAQHLIDYANYNIYKGVANDQIIDPATGHLTAAAQSASLLWTDSWLNNMQKGVHQDYNVSVTGGNDLTKAFFSLGYLGDEGIVPGSSFNRLNARTKIDQKIGKSISTGISLAYSRTDQKTFGNESSNYSNIFMSSQQIAPICPVFLYDEEGKPVIDETTGKQKYDYGTEHTRQYSSEMNPFANAEDCIQSSIRDNVTGRGYFTWDILRDLSFSTNIAYDVFNTREIEFMTPVAGDAKNVGGRGYMYSYKTTVMNVNELLTYSPTFGSHKLSFMLGHENNDYKYDYFYGHMTNFVDAKNPYFANAVNYEDMSSYAYGLTREGYFVKGDYNYDDRYYLTASVRRDASSIFDPAVRWGTFWAVGGSWRFSKEAFLAGASGWLNDGKLKASYGTQGNDAIGLYKAYQDLYRIDRVDGSAALTKTLRGNSSLTWEKSANLNVGIEGRLFDRFNFDVNYFTKQTNDLLYYSPLPSSQGSPAGIYRNEMDMKNVGFDYDLALDVIKDRKVQVRLTTNGMHYKNHLTKLPDSKDPVNFPDGYQNGNYWRSLGGSLYDWALIEYVGVDSKTGLPQYRNYLVQEKDDDGELVFEDDEKTIPVYSDFVQDGSEVMKDADGEPYQLVNSTANMATEDYRRHGKTAIPDFTGGFGVQVNAFGFDLNVQTAFQIGGWTYDSFYAVLMTSGEPGRGFHKDMFNRWVAPGQETNVPRLCYNGSTSIYDSSSTDRWLTSSSYFALRNVAFGYTLPHNLVRKAQIENVRIYLSGDNVYLKSARKGLDPRQSMGGTTGYGYSALSTYSVGVSLTL